MSEATLRMNIIYYKKASKDKKENICSLQEPAPCQRLLYTYIYTDCPLCTPSFILMSVILYKYIEYIYLYSR